MSLDFLTVRGPAAESPMAAACRADGARFALRRGWNVATGFGDEARERDALASAVGWTDVSHVAKLELPGDPAAAFGRAERTPTGWRCPVSAGRTLLLGDPGDEERVDGAIDVTSQLCALTVRGPAARETIARFCALDLRPSTSPAGSFRPGSVARTPGFVLVVGPDHHLLLCGAALGDNLWRVVGDAGRRLGGAPVGADVAPDWSGPDA